MISNQLIIFTVQILPVFQEQLFRNDSLYIYIFHPILMWALSAVFKKTGMLGLYSWIAPFAVLACTLAFNGSLRKTKILK